MTDRPLRFVVLGLSITSSWGNGHATTYRGLLRELSALGHDVLFLERDVPWYAAHRDLPHPPFCRTELYESVDDLKCSFTDEVAAADVVIIGSFVPDGAVVGRWVTDTACGVTAFYDIDTPVTLAKLRSGEHDYIDPGLVSRFDLYLSFSGGPLLERIHNDYGAAAVLPLYCSFDPALYHADPGAVSRWDLGYMGTYSADRQPGLERMLLRVARIWGGGRFAVAGPQYPRSVCWPANVERVEHLPPVRHRAFYTAQRFTLNLTRAAMVEAGYSPSVRLFEAAACGTPIISDAWPGLDTFFEPDTEILIARSSRDLLSWIVDMGDTERLAIARRARRRVLAQHTAAHRAAQLVAYVRCAPQLEPAALTEERG